MLTLILLVVLGGGAGLVTVWLVDGRDLSELLGPLRGRSLRRTRPGDTTRVTEPEGDDRPGERRFEPLVPAPAEPTVAWSGPPPAIDTATTTYEPVEVPLAPLPSSVARRDGARVPAAYTAIEGSYRDVARTPAWRKAVSLVTLLAVLLLIGVAIAALAGATIGAVAELVDSAVG